MELSKRMDRKAGLFSVAVLLVMAACSLSSTSAQADVVTFQEGVDGYASTVDTYFLSNAGWAANPTATRLYIRSGAVVGQSLLRFEDIIGGSAIPAGAIINSATLTLVSPLDLDGNQVGPAVTVYKVLQAWADTDQGDESVWSSYGNGVQMNDIEAASVALGSTGKFSTNSSFRQASVDITAAVQDWANGAPNYGLLLSTLINDDTLHGASSEYNGAEGIAARPKLTVDFTPVPEPVTVSLLGIGGLLAMSRRRTSKVK